MFFWVRKLHPLFDAYTGPYRLKHRYWIGLLLLVRVCLFLIFSFSASGPTINLVAIVVGAFCLLVYISVVGGIYKLWSLNVLENAFILNLGALSAAVGFYQDNTETVVPAITCTSVGVTFIVFVAIVFSHLVRKTSKSRVGEVLKSLVKRKSSKHGELPEATLHTQQHKTTVTWTIIAIDSDVS